MLVEIVEASCSRQITPLLDDYLHELSSYREVSIGATDSLSYPYLSAYFSESDRHAFLIQYGGQIVGFVFIREPSSVLSVAHQVAEFYIKPENRRLGIRRRAMVAV